MKNTAQPNFTRKFMFSFIAVTLLLAVGGALRNSSAQAPDYRNATLPIERRVGDLLSRMTIEEKAAQMQTLWVRKPQQRRPNGNFGDRGDFSPEEAAIVLKNGIGEIARQRERTDARRGAEYANAVQKWLKENTRLGIPVMLHDEILHGLMAVGGTNFPTPISLASSWDTELITKVFTAAALETRLRGSQHVLGPNLDLARDPRWGRTEETYGEDPYLVARMGVAAIKAIQGTSLGIGAPIIDGEHVMATAKHFAAHGQPEGGTNTAPGNFSERILREVFLPSFEAAVKEAGVLSVMPSYNEIDGVPSHKNTWLIEKLLRQEWGFRGLVAADYNGISELVSRHRVAVDRADAAQQALRAGVDIELPDPSCYPLLPQLISEGKVSLADIDKSVARVLRAKFQLGLFENPFVEVERAIKLTNSPAHQQLAAEAARRSIVLLKNVGNLLPLDVGKLQSFAVIGPNAAGVHLGGYSDDPQHGVSVLQGVRDKVGSKLKINYAEGCKITEEDGKWWDDKSNLADPVEDAKLIAEAVATAKASDVALLVVGGNEDTSKEAWADNHIGDRDTLDLVGRQNDLVKAIVETGKPVVVLLINSAPLSINYIAENVPAILEGFYLGQETGVAVADVLFGDTNPAGKLAVSIPRSVGQLPIYYNHKPTARRGYLYTSKEPLFPFGFGLSYTTFEYSDLKVAPTQIGPHGQAEVSVTVKNTGNRAGDEIVQLYIRDVVSSVHEVTRREHEE
ncbi:MAG: glycoside hydrolase family 3 C-terminal domain-containing protein [Acidobacteria bacterium]|nr:glycoside hydrolase family 3 C-terminal domain-containing protein [Acidobacteriota bacterium]MBI3422864.1 glycoside hydrolase family 3 C-terminal domain-containing protein [Acidobacteriota bacterium]